MRSVFFATPSRSTFELCFPLSFFILSPLFTSVFTFAKKPTAGVCSSSVTEKKNDGTVRRKKKGIETVFLGICLILSKFHK